MSLATALKGAVADARPLRNPDFRRLWVVLQGAEKPFDDAVGLG